MKRVALDLPDEEPPEKGGFLTIRVNKDWRLKHDGLQFSVQQRKLNAAKGVTYWSDVDIYVRSLSMAIAFLASRRIYMEPGLVGAEGMERVLKAIEETKSEALSAYTKTTTQMLRDTHKQVLTMRARMLPADYAALMQILDTVK